MGITKPDVKKFYVVVSREKGKNDGFVYHIGEISPHGLAVLIRVEDQIRKAESPTNSAMLRTLYSEETRYTPHHVVTFISKKHLRRHEIVEQV
ncbi:MAG: hypothetical protein ABR981_02345 [Candidatus Micrarchaeaceae archaeon]|jgi:hypothetical protein